MRHRVKGTALNVDTSHRRALNKFMATSFVEGGSMVTTLTKAKFIKPFIEKLVTKAKKNDQPAIRALVASLNSRKAVDTLLEVVAPKFAERNGGYTRIIKLQQRLGDNAPMARLEWVESMAKEKKEVEKVQKEKTEKKTSEKKTERKPRKVKGSEEAKGE
jgi:large subunit ribosomal protein L17